RQRRTGIAYPERVLPDPELDARPKRKAIHTADAHDCDPVDAAEIAEHRRRVRLNLQPRVMGVGVRILEDDVVVECASERTVTILQGDPAHRAIRASRIE